MAVIDGYAADEDLSPADGSKAYGAGGYGLILDTDLFPGDNAMAYGAGGYGIDLDAPVAGPDIIYRMRAYDSTLGRIVFWNSGVIDSSGLDYTGPGPLSDVVVQNVLGLPLLVLIPGTGIEAMPEQWVKLNVPAGQPATTMFTQVSTNFDTIKAIREGSIVGLGTRLSQAVTAGLLTVTVTINGVAGALSIGHSSGVGDEATQATGIDTYVPGDLLGIQYSTDAGLLPAGVIDLEAWFQVVEVP